MSDEINKTDSRTIADYIQRIYLQNCRTIFKLQDENEFLRRKNQELIDEIKFWNPDKKIETVFSNQKTREGDNAAEVVIDNLKKRIKELEHKKWWQFWKSHYFWWYLLVGIAAGYIIVHK